MKIGRKPAPVRVTNLWDDLCVEVICQSNPEIAGSPRNIFRYSDPCIPAGGRALNGVESVSNRSQ